jgi:hypothetical protein
MPYFLVLNILFSILEADTHIIMYAQVHDLASISVIQHTLAFHFYRAIFKPNNIMFLGFMFFVNFHNTYSVSEPRTNSWEHAMHGHVYKQKSPSD